MPNSTFDSYRTFEDLEIEKAWEKFIEKNDICDDELKSIKLAFFAGWKSHEKFYFQYYSDDGK